MPTPRRARRLLLTAVAAGAVGLGLLLASPAHADPGPTPNPVPAPAPTAPSGPVPTPTPGTPDPMPGPAPAPSPPAVGSDEDPAWYDVSGQIRKGITDFFLRLAESVLNPILDLLGRTVLATPDVTTMASVQAIWTTCAWIANTCFALFVVAAGFVLAGKDTVQTRYGVKELLPRLVIAGVAANTSPWFCSQAIAAANALTAAIAGAGVDGPSAARALTDQALGGGMAGLLQAWLVLAVVVMAFVVVIMYVMRLAAVIILVGVAPLALGCHALPHTEGLAYTWWRAFIAALGIQVGQAILLLVLVRVVLTPTGPSVLGVPDTAAGLIGMCAGIALLWMMIKLPGWMRQFVIGQSRGRGVLGTVIGAVIAVKTLGLGTGLAYSAARMAGAGPVPRGPSRGGGGSSGSGGASPRPVGGPRGSGGPKPARSGPRPTTTPDTGRPRPGAQPPPTPDQTTSSATRPQAGPAAPAVSHPGRANAGPPWRRQPPQWRPPTPPSAPAAAAAAPARSALRPAAPRPGPPARPLTGGVAASAPPPIRPAVPRPVPLSTRKDTQR